MQLKPSLIVIDAINAIIMRRQSAHKTSLSNTTRKAVAISLKGTRRPCQWTQQERHEVVVSITTILIPWQQLLSQERQLPQHKGNGHKKETLYAGNLRQIGQIHSPDLLQWTWDQQQNSKKELASRTKKNKKQRCCDTYVTPHAQRLLGKPQIEWPDRASDTFPSDERTSARDNNKNYQLVSNPKIKRVLVVQCYGLATATSSQVKKSKNNFGWLLTTRMPRLKARCANLA